MNYIKNILWVILIFSLLSSNSSVLAVVESEFNSKDSYELFEARVKNICKKYETEKRKNFKTKLYPEIQKEEDTRPGRETIPTNTSLWHINNAKKIYRENMNSIYKCAMLNIQVKSLEKVREKIENSTQKQVIDQKINSKIRKIELVSKSLNCTADSWQAIQKVQLLNETSYELCTYHSYLEYLRWHTTELRNLINENEFEVNTTDLSNRENTVKNAITLEIERAYKIFPIAYQAYSEYENNLPTHILLELLKDDFRLFRKKYHQAINPINQVVYKIHNAMRR